MTAIATAERPRTDSPPKVRTCRECGVVSRFLAGHRPVRNGWVAGPSGTTICPACHKRALSDRFNEMTDEERREVAREAILAAPKDAVTRVSDRTGIARPLVMSVKREMVAEGLVTFAHPAKPKPKPVDRPKPKPPAAQAEEPRKPQPRRLTARGRAGQAAGMRATNAKRVACPVCGFESNAGNVGRHRKRSGH